MRNRIYRAVVIWRDGDVEDADEIELFAESDAAAASAARRSWRLTYGARYPHCRIVAVEVDRKCRGVATHK